MARTQQMLNQTKQNKFKNICKSLLGFTSKSVINPEEESTHQGIDTRQASVQETSVKPDLPNEVPPATPSADLDPPPPPGDTGNPQDNLSLPSKEDKNIGKLEDSLNQLSDVDGFMAVGIFTPDGEMTAQVNSSDMKLTEIGSLANDVLMKAQKATDVMNVGHGQVVHIDAPKAHIIARCHNENEDFSQTAAGKAHVHLILLLHKDANLAMAKIKLESIVHEVADSFR